ncbi:FAD/NAD(P)-binding protein [Apiospora phragmitis]|uniref:FAD/NAD(P)-binding protein n=1 Tax=Apiospora phragmitis TaxID=2905665 RepID=A0ABR1VGN9_9PEZI
MLQKARLIVSFIAYVFKRIGELAWESIENRYRQIQFASQPPLTDHGEMRNIVVVGASYAGYHAARVIASSLPPNSPYRVVIIEPHSHFHFTWVLPRFCVVEQEHKAFIPYGPYLKGAPEGRVRWVHERVARVDRDSVWLEKSHDQIPYAFLVIASGAGAAEGLPSRVAADTKAEGMALLKDMQRNIKGAQHLVVVGGGAAGVELAADAKQKYPEKHVTLVHSRKAVMHRFGPELQAAALKGLENLGVVTILQERSASGSIVEGQITLQSGKRLQCDFLVNCTGQSPSSSFMAGLAPEAILPTGTIRVRPTLQIQDEKLPNVYVCGDVAAVGIDNPNARSAMRQGAVVGLNVVRAATGGSPTKTYKPFWGEGVIKLTLGLDKSISHVSDGKTELWWQSKERNLDLMSALGWRHLGAKPFDDDDDESEK